MRLNAIKDNPGARKMRVRVGRGIGSGLGKMGGRGGKGQTARTGVRLAGFEGGQMPLHRRLPKRGFNKIHRKSFNEVNLGAIQKAIDEKRLDPARPVDVDALIKAGVLRRPMDGLRLLAKGDLKTKISISADHASGTAKAAVEKLGGSVQIKEVKILKADVEKAKKRADKVAKAGTSGKKKAASEE